jgi:hypothetical protein
MLPRDNYIDEYKKNKRDYRNIKTSIDGGAKDNYLLVLERPYNKVSRLDIKSEAIMKSYFFQYPDECVDDCDNGVVDIRSSCYDNDVLDIRSSYYDCYAVIGNKYHDGSIIPQSLIKLLKEDIEHKKVKDNFRKLKTSDIYKIDPGYIFSVYGNNDSLHMGHDMTIEDINELDKCSNDIDVFLSYFSSGNPKQKYDETYPFDSIPYDETYPFDSIPYYGIDNVIVGLIGPNLIREKFDKKYFKFPKNIVSVMWYQPGTPDIVPWYALLKMKYKKKYIYGFFHAECCYTGFYALGDIRLYLSENLYNLLTYGVYGKIYDKIKRYITLKQN